MCTILQYIYVSTKNKETPFPGVDFCITVSVSQHRHYWHFGIGNSMLYGLLVYSLMFSNTSDL